MTDRSRDELISDCVHCGFCLPTCPTYVLWGEEMDSPRGRIQLMLQESQGEPLTPTMAGHFDACLGCMACVTACPSGVQYDTLIEQTRVRVEEAVPRRGADRWLREAIFALFPYRSRLALAKAPLRVYQALGRPFRGLMPPALSTLTDLAPPVRRSVPLPSLIPAVGRRRAVVGLLTGCVQHAFFPGVNAATARVLAAEGCDVVVPPDQGCCGALSVHSGRREEAQRFARALVDTFTATGIDYLVVNAAGCGSSLKELGELLPDDPRASALSLRVRDLSEVLVELGPAAPRHPLRLRIAYHDACHLGHAQGVRAQPRRLLAEIPDLVLHEIPEAELCCGSAGIWNILNPGPAAELATRKATNVLSTGAEVLVTANPGCLMQIAAGLARAGAELRLAHTAEVLDASIRGVNLRR
ncbi:(Fe-S)-binding protein [Dactylosporangium sucinum]|uniref:Glycolate oxidase iron-sulfur subunit n=1 Tax=Dactylosporangium sucinum TaxID=1424081 RepID=A0A917T1G3_9ACTN|nr:heterodisulfide reductase-related iron-sulfur binding cluster [Dactylosporangium sucinum]GGM07444.1 glycolate oxidase iron-sulfur subunit [Dactylosporangium sucinum]